MIGLKRRLQDSCLQIKCWTVSSVSGRYAAPLDRLQRKYLEFEDRMVRTVDPCNSDIVTRHKE